MTNFSDMLSKAKAMKNERGSRTNKKIEVDGMSGGNP